MSCPYESAAWAKEDRETNWAFLIGNQRVLPFVDPPELGTVLPGIGTLASAVLKPVVEEEVPVPRSRGVVTQGLPKRENQAGPISVSIR